jgi:hypothetical protein
MNGGVIARLPRDVFTVHSDIRAPSHTINEYFKGVEVSLDFPISKICDSAIHRIAEDAYENCGSDEAVSAESSINLVLRCKHIRCSHKR